MKQSHLYALWGGMYILCAGLGFIPNASGFGAAVLIALAVAFFLPGGILLYRAQKSGDRKGVLRIRKLAAASLAATLILLILTFLFLRAGDGVGVFLHIVLGLVSCPMYCAQYPAIGLFLWACLLSGSFLTGKNSG